MKRAVVVFSGGQDSTTCLAQALHQYDEVHCVTFDYGQRHRAEIDVARDLALKLGARAHKVLDVTLLSELAVSSLTRDNIPVPDYEPDANGIPNTFVPGRNILFLTLAAIYAYQVQLAPVISQRPGFGFIDPHQWGFKANIFRHPQAYGMVQGFDELIATVRVSREIRFTNAGNDRLRLHLIRVNRRQR